jgi:C-terminal processing protease CtpA/Prc
MLIKMRKIISLSLLSILAACGGGGGNSGDSTTTPPGNSGLPPSSTLANLCANPRANTSDRQGTIENEKSYLRSFVDETYLWYADIPSNIVAANYATPQLYFDVLKTNAKTSSGASVDQFHWSQTTASWNASSSGIAQDYGIKWMAKGTAPSRIFLAADVAPGSPAALAGIKRGDIITSIDGVVATEATADGVAALNEILSPTKVVAHKLGFNGAAEISLTPATYSTSTVLNVKTIPTASGTVGYFTFDTHIAKSEAELIAAIKQLKAANVTDLVIDLRYNGGGLLYVASQLAYMIAGPATTNGQIFEKLTYNDKLAAKIRYIRSMRSRRRMSSFHIWV